jgi:AcrR family transcriptional regulator
MDIQDRILSAAAQLFSEVGSRGATTRRIAERAGVNEVTLFRHFGTKDNLITQAIALAGKQTPGERLPDIPREPIGELKAWCRHHLAVLYESRSFLRASMAEFDANPEVGRAGCDLPARIASDLVRYVRKLQARGMAATSVDAVEATQFLMGAMLANAISRDIFAGRYNRSIEQSADRYAEMFLRSIGPGKGF